MTKLTDTPVSPSDLLESGQFNNWYEGQYDLLLNMLEWYYSPARFLGVSVPTGSGKSLLALLLAKLTGVRTVILSATKGLTHQYMVDARGIGGVEARGRNNFRCLLEPSVTAEDGICNLGLRCDSTGECPYRVQLARAQQSRLVTTNYAYWLAQSNYAGGLGSTDLLILDEAHLAFGALEGFLTVSISRSDVHPVGITFPTASLDRWEGWRMWAEAAFPIVEQEASRLNAEIRSAHSMGRNPSSAAVRAARRSTALTSRLQLLSTLDSQWVVQPTPHGHRFVPKWVSGYSDALFRVKHIPKVVLMSAILTHRTADYLGVPQNGDRSWLLAGNAFPAANTPIYHINTARINYRTSDMETGLWVSRIDQIIQRRLDRKGLIFTVSYDRARLLLSRSRFKDIMVTHSTHDVSATVEMFREASPPIVLVSPSVTTGFDFPMQDGPSQYIIIGKIPYPDTNNPVTKARHEDDPDWSSYMAMETLIQSSGRMSRSAQDKTEVLIVDDNWRWFWKRYKGFAPSWFINRVRGSLSTVPNPLV